ncbi:hypothetical protein ILUMI_26655 [Ignelater luminosus]|uniref:CRAL/TRIO N-terminal domain-containing protein n=1 Tax=Ignelater luminosus TaxID=2038154 RepID=A0A8K0C7L1_IGNLU|nr:hypothetical protein ILUMI_26655 [Ignelater luminosus]
MSIRPLPSKLQEKAEKELNEDTNRINEDLEHIEEWLKKQPHLNVRKDPQFLISFLRCSKFSLQRTKEKLDFFYTMKTLTPEFFMNKDPFNKEIKEILDNA